MEGRGEQDDEERRPLGGSNPTFAGIHPNSVTWPTVDGPLGLSAEESVDYARRFFFWGFALLPFLWAVNCFYFWPVLWSRASSSPSSYARIRPYVVRSAVGFLLFAVLLSSWALTFTIGGERLFGPAWKNLVMYNVGDKLGLTGWM
ncbi:probable gamma-secretase subunit PEN-2 [Typha latifolia]|uniref:probable gamma-secretase subunit PEN-2 n=1 Tax=Typha latifolia TaxID=4733 RepID=UPI003C2C792D